MRLPRFSLWLFVPTALLLILVAVRLPAGAVGTSAAQSAPAAVATEEEVRTRCGTVCHQFPAPDILPRSAWRDELVRMMLIQEGVPEPAGANSFIPLPPDWLRLLRYYEAKAPDRLPDPEPWPAVDPARMTSERRSLKVPSPGTVASVAHVRFLDVDEDGKLDVVASEMRAGPVLAGLATAGFELRPIAKLRHPAHIEQADLDKDGLKDLIVADLGSFQPADHQSGSVSWLRRLKDGTFKAVTIAQGLARLSDARVADFDGDGDLDVILAIFGWRKTGNVTLLENRTKSWSSPAFHPKVIVERTGAIHVPVVDLNSDGKPDFLALFAQEHEAVYAFINTGKGLDFSSHRLYAAPHPNWGSSGIEPVDLDKDGDLDILFTHGDTFDDFVLKPYHGVLWLENTTGMAFEAHALATLPGAHRAQAVDFDADGDLDIMVAAMVQGGELAPKLTSIGWLEQLKPGVFERRTIESGRPYHATMDVADYDGDGDSDLLVGWFAFAGPLESWVDLWENRRK
jgi:hypothetical protein